MPPATDAPLDPPRRGGSDVREFILPPGSAGSYWCHPHVHGDVERQLLPGLAGPVIITGPVDDEPALRDADDRLLGTGLIVPHRRRAGRPLLRGQEEDNAEHRRVRARVEHTFARMKSWKILRDCRQKGDGLHHAIQAVATMHNLAMTG